MSPSDEKRSKTVAAKAELRRIAGEVRERIQELNETRIFATRPFRKQIDVAKISAAVDEVIEDAIIEACHSAHAHVGHLSSNIKEALS